MKSLLRDIAVITAGQGAPQGESNYCDNGTPFVKAGNLLELIEGKDIKEIQNVSEEVARSHKLKLYPKGTILFAKSGMSCLKGYVYVLPQNAYVVSHLACITPKEEISKYLKYYFTLHRPNRLIKDASYPSISLNDIGELKIDIKSPSEREKIVEVLDSISNLIKKNKEELQKLEELIKARFVELFGDIKENSHNYPVKKLSAISQYWNGLTYKPENVTDDEEKGILVLRSSNIQNGTLSFEDNVFVDCQIKEKQYVKENDILMCSRNGSARLVGKTAIIKGLSRPTSFGAFMMIIRSDYYPYLKTYFDMDAFRSQISTGTSTINQITGNMLNQIVVPVPDMELVKEYEEFCKQIDKSKSICQKKIAAYQELLDKKMDEYFNPKEDEA